MSSQPTKPTVEKLAVDAEDDLDDLDDLLDEFNPGAFPTSPKPSPGPPPPTAATTTTFGRPRTNTRVDAPPKSVPGTGKLAVTAEENDDEEALNNEFAQELAREMENLMREITSEGGKDKDDAASETMTDEERGKALKAAWEAMLVEGMNANAGDLANLGEEIGPSKEKAAGGAFQDKIKQAMDKLKDSESKMGGASSGAAPTPESLEALLQSLGDLGLGGEGGDEKELAGFLETMMSQLMSKDVLYDPLKELAEGFPPYLANPPKPLPEEDKKRYDNQLVCVKKILVVFEKQDYSDGHEEYSKQIVELMSEMQTYGSPPSEIMGPLPPGFDAMSSEEGCTVA